MQIFKSEHSLRATKLRLQSAHISQCPAPFLSRTEHKDSFIPHRCVLLNNQQHFMKEGVCVCEERKTESQCVF